MVCGGVHIDTNFGFGIGTSNLDSGYEFRIQDTNFGFGIQTSDSGYEIRDVRFWLRDSSRRVLSYGFRIESSDTMLNFGFT